MAEKINKCEGIVETLLKGMDTALSTKTVVGQPMEIGDVIIVPLVDVSFAFGASSSIKEEGGKNHAGGGLGGKMSPNAVLVIKNGTAKMVTVKGQDTVGKIIDMIPEIVDKFTAKKDGEMSDEEIIDAAFPDEELNS